MGAKLYYLPNAVPVIVDHMDSTQLAAVGIFVSAGTLHETKVDNGVAHFLEHMSFQGTTSRTALDLNIEINDLGAESNAHTSHDWTSYEMSGLGCDAATLCSLLGDMVCNSTIPAKELETERGVILQEIRTSKDDNEDCAGRLVLETAYPRQSCSAEILGSKENVENMGRSVLQAFHDAHYHGGNIFVSVAGDIDAQAVLSALEPTVGSLSAGPRSAFVQADYKGGHAHEEKMQAEQIQLRMLFKSCAMGDSRRPAANLLADILGGHDSSRLFQEIRQKRGLVYGIAAWNTSSYDRGEFNIWAGTDEEGIQALIPILCDELNKIRKQGITAAELDRTKKQFQVALAREQDSVDSRMMSHASIFNYFGQLRSPQEREAAALRVTGEDIKSAANEILSGVLTVATVGQGKNIEPYEQIVKRLKL